MQIGRRFERGARARSLARSNDKLAATDVGQVRKRQRVARGARARAMIYDERRRRHQIAPLAAATLRHKRRKRAN